jgi:Fe2+ or Zn2+ uptake regulation protein
MIINNWGVLMSDATLDSWLVILQKHGCRITGPRFIVAQILVQSHRALSPQDVYEKARQYFPNLGLVSVYRTMQKLEEVGLIQRLHQHDKCQAFIAAFQQHEHILVCSRCGLVKVFQGGDLSYLIQSVEKDTGYQISEHLLQFFGLCKDCQNVKKGDDNA